MFDRVGDFLFGGVGVFDELLDLFVFGFGGGCGCVWCDGGSFGLLGIFIGFVRFKGFVLGLVLVLEFVFLLLLWLLLGL